MTPNTIRTLETLLRWRVQAAGLASVTVDTDRGRIRGWVGGSGPPLMLVHGFGADALWGWHPQIRTLAARRRLFVPDLLYFGNSTGNGVDFSLETQAAALIRWLDALCVGRLDVVGISYGGLVVQALAQSEPARIRKIVLVDSPGHTYTDADHEHILRHFRVDDVAEIVVPRRWQDVRRLVDLAWYRPPPTPGWVLRQVYAHMFTTQRAEKQALLGALDRLRSTPHTLDYSLPPNTLLIWGRHDPLFPPAVGARLAASRSDARLVILEQTRHAPNLEAARAFNQQVLSAVG